MKMKTKGIIAALVAFAIVAVYPKTSVSKTNDKDLITLTDKNLVILNGEVNDSSVADAISQLQKLDAQATVLGKQKPIYLFLYTPGGSIQAGLELIEAVNGMKRPVHTVTLFAASMGWQIAQNMGDRLILKNGILMSHHAMGQFEGNFGGNSPSQLDNRYAVWLQRIKELDEQTVKRTNGKQTMDSYRKQYDQEMWLTGSQSVEQGYADAVVAVRCDKTLSGTDGHDVNFLGIDIHYETSKCPLITGLLNIKVTMPPGGGDRQYADAQEVKAKFISKYNLDRSIH
jgi:ATP-dependent Clp protease protease subunit